MARTVREAVGVFDDAQALENAVFDLETHGFDRAALSLLASENSVERKLGHGYKRIDEMEDEPDAPRSTFFSKVSRAEEEGGVILALAYIGGVSAGLVAAPALIGAGAGAAIGAVLAGVIHQSHARHLQEQLERGGLLLWVQVRDAEQEKKACEVLQKNGARDVHVHEITL